MRSRQKGALLAEVILAFALIVITLVVVASMFPFAYRADQKAWKKSRAQSLCEAVSEEFRGAEFETLSTENRTVNIDGQEYRIAISVTDQLPPLVKRKAVNCVVKWDTQNGVDSYSQSFVIARFSR